MRRAAKRDQVELGFVKVLRDAGWSVDYLSMKDGPDLLLGAGGRWVLAEVKTGAKKLRPGQAVWHQTRRGGAVVVLRTMADVVALITGETRGESATNC